jgi:hypothetical protein
MQISITTLINIPLTRTAAEGKEAEFFTLLLTSSARWILMIMRPDQCQTKTSW